jgi:hypothetical protein
LGIVGSFFLAGCAGAPQKAEITKVATTDAFHDTKLLETELKRGVSTAKDIERLLGKPTGSGAVLLSSIGPNPEEMWFYQDMEMTDFRSSAGVLQVDFRQQVLVILLRDDLFDGFMWFSNSDKATAWVKDSLRGKGTL